MKFLFAALATLLFTCSSAFGQNTYRNYYQYNYRPNYYQTQSQYRNYGRYNSRVFVYNYRPSYYNYSRNSYTNKSRMYNSYYNKNHSSFSGFLMNFYYNNR